MHGHIFDLSSCKSHQVCKKKLRDSIKKKNERKKERKVRT